MKTRQDPLWETKWKYIEKWQRGVLITTTSRYHNLVIHWNVWTLLQVEDPIEAIKDTTYHLMDDEVTDPSVVLLTSEQSSRS